MPRIDDTDHTVDGFHPCGRCATTGQFITGSLNGQPTGPGGICYRCNGQGYHDQADRRRNHYHDRHAFEEAAQAMARQESDYNAELEAWDLEHYRNA